MPTAIDESGDTGFGLQASPRYQLTAVHLPTVSAVEDFRNDVRLLRGNLKLRENAEFKFFDTHQRQDVRAAFFHVALRQPFQFATVYIEKQRSAHQSHSTPQCYHLTATGLAVLFRSVYATAHAVDPAAYRADTIIVDDNQDRAFLESIKSGFHVLGTRDRPRKVFVGKVKFHKSHTDELIQLADMVCGAVASHLDGKSRWYEQIQGREISSPWAIRLGSD